MLKGRIKATFEPDDQFVDPIDFMKLVEDGIIIIDKEEVE